jgi:aspartate/methionine/tyrosine aminotransferase
VVDGFSKTYAVTGWRMGWIHGPAAIIDKLTMMQQYTFVCAPHPLQWAGMAALQTDMTAQVDEYRKRRDFIVNGLRDASYEVAPTGGAFYVFPKVPADKGTGTEFVARAIEKELLIIPGNIFSTHDTHFRISYAASWDMLERGLAVLRELTL